MTRLFSQVLNMSLSGSVVILCVLVARLALKRFPKRYSYVLWAVVLFRLLCPVSITAPVSVLEITRPQVAEVSNVSMVVYEPLEAIALRGEDTVHKVQAQAIPVQELQQEKRTPGALDIVSWVWLAGMGIMVLHSSVSYLRLRKKLVGAVLYRGETYLTDEIQTPFALGIVRPKIYLPVTVPMEERRYIIAHERHHIRRFDHIIKLLAYGALCLHWFNPLVWIAFAQAGKDMEMSCDEAVIKKLGKHIRADYASSLLRLSTGRRTIAGTPLSFGEGDPKGRIKNMAKWKQPKVWVSAVCSFACVLVLAACAVNPEGETAAEQEGIVGPASIGIGELEFTLPEGLTKVQTEEQTSSTSLYNSLFTDGTDTVGGIYIMDKPELELDSLHNNTWQWVEALDVPEKVPEEVFLMQVSWSEGDVVSATYGKDGIAQRTHVFFSGETVVYDLWYDTQTMEEQTAQALLESAFNENRSLSTKSRTFLFGELYITLPEECTYREEQNVVEFFQGETLIGGMTGYEIPKDADQGSSDWLYGLLPEGNDPNFGYMGGGSNYGDYEVNFFTDVPPEVEIEKVDRLHTFFYSHDQQRVYDVWFDTLVTSNTLRNSILETVSGEWEYQSPEPEETKVIVVPENAVSFTDLYSGYDGTAEFVILTGPLDRDALEVENGLPLEQIMENAKKEFQATRVNSFGFEPEAMGHEGRTTVEICITDLRRGEDYLIAADTPVPTLELWGNRYYHFENGDTMEVEEEPFEIMTMNALDGTVLARLGKKN